MRFVCDEMLKKLGQWLRIAGYDVVMLPDGSEDRELLELAVREHRLLLTRDSKLKEYKQAAEVVVLLVCNDLDECVAQLNNKLPLDWLHKPFSRCKICNTKLIQADASMTNAMPPAAKEQVDEVLFCPTCKQLFWQGSHVARMQQQLRTWNQQYNKSYGSHNND